MACPSSMASERKPPELTPSTTFDNISLDAEVAGASIPEVSCPKLDATLEVLERIREADEKVVIFTRFLRIQRLLQSAISEQLDVWPDVLNGQVTGNRQNMIDSFERRPGFNVLILSHDVGGVGVNITGASHVIHYTRPWNPAKENQATDRVHRIGQLKPVHVGSGRRRPTTRWLRILDL